MLTRNRNSHVHPQASSADSATPVSVTRVWTALVMLFATGCTSVTARLDARFDADPLGAPPTSPLPTPPGDVLVWRGSMVAASVVVRQGSDTWVRAVPLSPFIIAPDSRQTFLIANTDPFTTSPAANIRGSIRLRIVGLGTVGIGVRPVQSGGAVDFIGGAEVSTFVAPAPPGVFALRSFSVSRLTDLVGLISSGQLSGYTPGNVVDISWTVDQASRTFSATVPGGPTQSSVFDANVSGLAVIPIQKLQVYVWLAHPTAATVVFVDNISVEEYR
jgi:hypothetical protein